MLLRPRAGLVFAALLSLAACEPQDLSYGQGICGNNVREDGEQCDGSDLGPDPCGAGKVGTAVCTLFCTLDTSGCTAVESCNNNGIIDPGEACDGADFGGLTCTSQGYNGGVLACTDACELNTEGCCQNACVFGDKQCTADGTGMEVCQQGAAGCLEVALVSCEAGQVCDDASGTATCVTPCVDACPAEGASRCTGSAIEVCSVSNLGCLAWQEERDCANTSYRYCDDSQGRARCSDSCVPQCNHVGQQLCRHDGIFTCVESKGCLALEAEESCVAQGLVCDPLGASGPRCHTCSSECESDGSTRCHDDRVQSCTEQSSGCLTWEDTADCTLNGEVCYQGQSGPVCVEPCDNSCEQEGATSCNGPVVELCEMGPTGCLAPVFVTDCSLSHQLCRVSGAGGAACEPICVDQCTEGALRCGGDKIQVCAMGAAGCWQWTLQEDCEAQSAYCDSSGAAPVCLCLDNCSNVGDTRCHQGRVETCGPQSNGCMQYGVSEDCAAQTPALACYEDALEAPACVQPTGESCDTAAAITQGSNEVAWTSSSATYLVSAPSCVDSGALQGPEVVMSYQAPADGYVTVSVPKPTTSRWVLLATGPSCDVSSELGCGSNFSESSLATTVAVDAGQEVRFLLRNHLAGAAGIPKPLPVEVRHATCLDSCSNEGEQRCNGGDIETCGISPGGCLEWLVTTECSADANGPFCFDGGATPVCRPCLDTCSNAGLGRCVGSSAELCQQGPQGCNEWQFVQDCNATGQSCKQLGGNAFCGALTGEDCGSSIVLTGGTQTVHWTANSMDHLIQGAEVTCGIDKYNYIDIVFQYLAPPGVSRIDWSVPKTYGHEIAVEVSAEPCGILTTPLDCDESWLSSIISGSFNVTPGVVYTFYMTDTTYEGNQKPPNPLVWTITEYP